MSLESLGVQVVTGVCVGFPCGNLTKDRKRSRGIRERLNLCNELSRAQLRPDSVLEESPLLSCSLWGSAEQGSHSLELLGSRPSAKVRMGILTPVYRTGKLHLEEGVAPLQSPTSSQAALPRPHTENKRSPRNMLTFFSTNIFLTLV